MPFPPQNTIHIQKPRNAFAIQGGSHFTAEGLGEVQSSSIDINIGISDVQTTKQLHQWYETLWNDQQATKDVQQSVLDYLDFLAKDNPETLIYFLTLYNFFKDSLEDINEDNIIRSKTGFKDTIIWNKLYKFQKDGVIGAIDKIEKHNGCIIADSVGLGKTFEVLAVIKYYELRNDQVLVLCPKKLRENWTIYTVNDKRNILAKDRFNYDVLNHTDLLRSQGQSGEINLKTLNWENYDLLVIDESHNFRNSGTKAEGLTRYQRLMQDVIQSGVQTKVLILSATPVNSRLNDLKNQLAFMHEGIDSTYHQHGISSISNTLQKTQRTFNKWFELPDCERTSASLLNKLSFDYFKLLDLLTIALSRKHIEKYYDITEIGAFPERLKPINIKTDIDTLRIFPELQDVNRTIQKLTLAGYLLKKVK